MAAAGAHLPLWDKDNVEEAKPIHGTPLDDTLTQSLVTLRENLELDDIWAHLRTLKVLKRTDEETLKYGKARPRQVEALVDFILQGPSWMYHGLMRAIALTRQMTLIPKGGPDPQVYADHQTVPEAAEDTRPPLEQQLLKLICDHCKSYDKYLMRAHIFAFDGDPGDDYIDIAPCYIDVQPNMKDDNRVLVPIDATKILDKIGDKSPPRVIRLYAQPGDGKTSFTMNVARSWSKAFLNQVTEENGKLSLKSKCPLWTTMVFIKARDIQTSVEDAIREGLGCKEEDEETMMAHIRKGDGVAILVEAMDELRDPKAIEELKNYVKKCKKKGGPTVLITSRTDLCSIDGQDFDRFLTLEGFSEEQALEYVKRYTETCNVPEPTRSSLASRVYEHATLHRTKMKAVLSNPLQLHIYCALVMRGEIELSETDELNIPKLFCPLERYLLRRAGVSVTKNKEHANSFYRFCMHAILTDLREFPKALLEEFNVIESYYVFLNRLDRRGHDGGLEAFYSFSHEMVLEFFASRYVYTLNPQEQLCLLLVACCDESWRNIQYIIFQMLAQEGDSHMQLMQTMIRSILVLQYKGTGEEHCEKSIADLMHLNEHIKTLTPPRNTLCSKDRNFIMRDVDIICGKINNAFEEHADQLRAANWLSDVHSRDESAIFEHVLTCLKSCPLHLRTLLIKSTIRHLMPGKLTPKEYENSLIWFYPVGDARWAMVNSRSDQCTIAAWCPADATEALLKEMTMHPSQRSLQEKILCLGCDCFNDLWGPPDEIMLSKEQWRLFLHLASQWTTGFLTILFSEETKHQSHLFSCIQSNAKLISHITVGRGKANLDNLMCWVSRCRQAGADLSICDISVILTERTDEKDSHNKNNVATLKPEVQFILKDWTRNTFKIEMDGQTPIVEVLPCILDHTEELVGCKEVTVVGGTANIDDILNWQLLCKQRGSKLKLENTHICVIRSRGDTSGHSTSERPALEVVLRVWEQDRLDMELEEKTPLVDLLSHLLKHSKHLSECAITVTHGATTLDDLMMLVSRYERLDLYLSLQKTNVFVTEHIQAKIDIDCQMKYIYSFRRQRTRIEGQTIKLKVGLEGHISLTDVFPHIVEHIEYLSRCDEVDVNGGTAGMADLKIWVARCRQKGLKLKLQNIHLLVSESRRSKNKTPEHGHSVTPMPALQVVVTDWSKDWSTLNISLTKEASPADLMVHLLDHSKYLSRFEKIELHGGTSKLEVLATCLSRCKEAGLKLELHRTNVRSEQMRVKEYCPHDLETTLTDEAEYPTKVQLRRWTQKDLEICVSRTGPLDGLLSYLLDHAAQFLQCKSISVSGGITHFEDLIACLSRSKQLGLSLTLYNSSVIASSEWRSLDQSPNNSPNEALQIQRTDTGNTLCFFMEYSTLSLVGLLSHLLHCLEHLTQKDVIEVVGGRADLQDLVWVTRFLQLKLDLSLYRVVVHGSMLQTKTNQSPLYVKVDQWNRYRLVLTLDETTPLTSLLSYFHQHAADTPLFKRMAVYGGTIELPDLVVWASKYKWAGLHIEFRGTHVVPVIFVFNGWQSGMTIILPESTQLPALLSWLIAHAAHLTQFPKVTIQGGTAALDDLICLIYTCKEAKLDLEFGNVHAVLEDETKEQKHRRGQLKNTDVQKGLIQVEPGKHMTVDLDETSSFRCLLLCLLKHTTQLSQYNSINVTGGRAELDELLTSVARCREEGLNLGLHDVHVVLFKKVKVKVKKHCSSRRTVYPEAVALQMRLTLLLVHRLSIAVDRRTPLADVVPCLLERMAELSQCKAIEVHSGTAELRDLLTWVSSKGQSRVQLEFYDTMVTETGTGVEDRVVLHLKEWAHNRVRVSLSGGSPLTSLLPLLLEHAADFSQCESIIIENAIPTLAELIAFLSSLLDIVSHTDYAKH